MRCSFRTHPFSWVQFPGFAPWAGMHCPLQRRQPTVSDQCWTGKLTSRWPGTLAPVSTTGPQATSLKTMAPNPLLRIRPHAKKTFGEAFGAATGVSDPRLQKIRIRNHCTGGDAATVAGYAGPGFHNWPAGHIPQDNGSESASSQPAPYQKDVRRGVRRGDRGQRPTATEDPDLKPTAQAATPPL
jgi:hypothetical protein